MVLGRSTTYDDGAFSFTDAGHISHYIIGFVIKVLYGLRIQDMGSLHNSGLVNNP